MPEKLLAVIAYLFSLPGVLIAAIAGKKNRFCLHHARRSLELFLFLACIFCVWYIAMYLLILIPYAGFPIAISLFGIVVAGAVFCFVLGIMGIVKALKGSQVVFPLITGLLESIRPFRKLLGMFEV
ncbi:MAG: hypothetical protein LBQ38_07860 [Spirochaetaceae bacterium]|jgi:uncharacterized membrane protein|nr:hypothetical protein [Spirochaetaceae bacterium]